ncbi:MAG TPA: alanine/ornithine racemase family PLP-dependent enzyme [Acidimicrobiales bacterium]
MSTPRLEIRLDRIRHNARNLVGRLGSRGIAVCGVTKATLGSHEVAAAMLAGGSTSIGESRIENVEALRRAGVGAEITLVRSPMPSQVERVVSAADLSLNSEIDVILQLSASACQQERTHGVVLMVELGDLREGIMPGDLLEVAREVVGLPGIVLRGIGTNLACHSGVVPDAANMAELSALATSIEAALDVELEIVSGGNSANLDWVLDAGSGVGRINHLRLGESILLGREPLRRSVPEGLETDAFALVGEVIESKHKPFETRGSLAQAAFGQTLEPQAPRDAGTRVIVAVGRQDIDPDGLTPPTGYEILGASSDHLLLTSDSDSPAVGSQLRFGLTYSALLRAMTSPFVARRYLDADQTSSADEV